MPRRPREWEPGAIYHVGSRAHGGEPIFAMDEDREFVLERAARVFREEGGVCFGWAVMVNHYHMLVRFPGPPGGPMHRLNTMIAKRVRRIRGGEGAVFQDRFFGGMCKDDDAVLTRLGYVTANPIHHRVVASVAALESYPWSSLGEVMGRRPVRLADPSAAFALLDAPRGRAEAALIALLEVRARIWEADDAARPAPRDPDTDVPLEGDEAVAPRSMGSPRGAAPDPPARTIRGRAPSMRDWDALVERRARLRGAGWTPARLLRPACALVGRGADPDALRAGERDHPTSRARAIVAHVACDHAAWPTGEVAAAVGVSESAVVRARRRGAAILASLGTDADAVLRRSQTPQGD